MRRFIDATTFDPERRDDILAMFDARALRFRDLITQKMFKKCLELLKNSK